MKRGVFGFAIPDIVERQRAVPFERLPDPCDGLAHLRIDDADLEHVAAAGPFRGLPIDMADNQASVIEHRLGTFERSDHRRLDHEPVCERMLCLQLIEQRIAPPRVAHPPDPGARGAEGSLDEERNWPLGGEFVRRANDLGPGLRHVEPRQELGETGLALHLLERLEVGERYPKAFWKLFSRSGEQIGLLMHR
jgi:hypothetical protein